MHTNQLACKRHPHSVRIWMIFLAAVLGSLTEKCKFLINISYFVKLKKGSLYIPAAYSRNKPNYYSTYLTLLRYH